MDSSTKRRVLSRRTPEPAAPARPTRRAHVEPTVSRSSARPRVTQSATTAVKRVGTSTAPPRKSISQAPSLKKKSSVIQQASHSTRKSFRNGSLVHEAVHRAYRATLGQAHSSETRPPDYAAECERLRADLERVMDDHARQADEIVALRALARSMKEEVESMQEAMSEEVHHGLRRRQASQSHLEQSHEFFQLDEQIDTLRADNEQLRKKLEQAEKDKLDLQAVVDHEIPRFEVLTVQARAELESVTSQLLEEQATNDALRSELAYFKARSRSPVRVQPAAVPSRRLRSEDLDDDKENGSRGNQHGHASSQQAFRSSLMSSMASLSMSAASQFSTQVQDDLDILRGELRRLHRSIDASVAKSHGSMNDRHQLRSSTRPENADDGL